MEPEDAGPNYVNQDGPPELPDPTWMTPPQKDPTRERLHAGARAMGVLIAFRACGLIPPVHRKAVDEIIRQWEAL